MDNLDLKKLTLRNFRSYKNLNLQFDSKFIYFSGPNGIGKTNILEAISLFSPGRGLRNANISDLNQIKNKNLWHISAILNISNIFMEIEIGLDKTGKKHLRIDGKKKPLFCLAEIFKILWITPLMDRLWIGASNERRRFLDRLVMNFFPHHAKYCILYDQALTKRNLLFKENEKDEAWFIAIEKQLAEIGYFIDKYRREVINLLSKMQLNMKNKGYFPILDIGLNTNPINNMNEFFENLKKNRKNDYKFKRTLIGPHKSDLIIHHIVKNMPAKNCSTGEQKSLLLSLFILSSLAISKKFQKPPIILLDEIVAHLDKENLKILLEQLISIDAQIFASGTDKINFDIFPTNFLSYNLNWDKEKKCMNLN